MVVESGGEVAEGEDELGVLGGGSGVVEGDMPALQRDHVERGDGEDVVEGGVGSCGGDVDDDEVSVVVDGR
ncbi:hypothetical protein ACHIPZ_06565 [Antrihabitans sp. NCIMB 15449]|uniref:Uncharacterized protein n=1 Tax=Antrihabitans spumae TaxID=3373370 RepID=A0ABW7JJN4_9NOCA